MANKHGFTLIELSIVLVIIGLLVGGVFVGRDLIFAAGVRAQITQIEKYNQGVNTFRDKFGGLPGDIDMATASRFGFTIGTGCAGGAGNRDNNGLIEANVAAARLQQVIGETGLFWQDLSNSKLIEGAFPPSGLTPVSCDTVVGDLSITPGALFIGNYIPVSKMQSDNYVYVYQSGGNNWFGLSAVATVNASAAIMTSNTTIPVTQAYKIDMKMDDGLPRSGIVVTDLVSGSFSALSQSPNTALAGGQDWTCYDTTTGAYSITPNNGIGRNCALSFKFN